MIGRSNIVGRPVSILLSQKGMDATVTVVHSRTKNIQSVVSQADIIIAAIGSPGFVTSDMVKIGAVVIDVGTTRIESSETKSGYRLAGDVDFENVAPKCSYITPVPGGVGPMTRVSLLRNTLLAARKRLNNLDQTLFLFRDSMPREIEIIASLSPRAGSMRRSYKYSEKSE